MFVFAVLLIFASIVFCRFYVIVLQSGCKDRHNFENSKIKMQKKCTTPCISLSSFVSLHHIGTCGFPLSKQRTENDKGLQRPLQDVANMFSKLK